MKANNRKNIAILSLTLAVVMLGFGMVMPIFPFYIESMGASGSELGLLIAISPLMQLLFAPIWGSVSDRQGRKPVLAVGLLGYGVSMLLFGLATKLWMLRRQRGRSHPFRRHPGGFDRTVDQTVGGGGRHQGHAAGQRP